MTIWERLFGTPERTAKTLEGIDQIDACWYMEAVYDGEFQPERCKGCLYECGRYGCERKMDELEWLESEVG